MDHFFFLFLSFSIIVRSSSSSECDKVAVTKCTLRKSWAWLYLVRNVGRLHRQKQLLSGTIGVSSPINGMRVCRRSDSYDQSCNRFATGYHWRDGDLMNCGTTNLSYAHRQLALSRPPLILRWEKESESLLGALSTTDRLRRMKDKVSMVLMLTEWLRFIASQRTLTPLWRLLAASSPFPWAFRYIISWASTPSLTYATYYYRITSISHYWFSQFALLLLISC